MNYGAPTKITSGKPISRTAVAPTTLEQAAKDYRALLIATSTKRQIFRGGQSANLIFQSVDRKVLRAAMVTKTGPMFYTWLNGQVEDTAPEVTLSLAVATEQELITARSMVPAASAGQIDVLLKMVRDGVTPAAPVRVEIVNANELAPAIKVAAVKRGDDGKISGLVVESIVSPT